MLRVKNLPTEPEPKAKQFIADFFKLAVEEVVVEIQQETYSIDISNNVEAQQQYKKLNPWGNIKPQQYDFTNRILLYWNGTKIQPM